MTSKIHAATEANGRLIRFRLTPGQWADCGQALPLLDGLSASYVVADKGYDANFVVEAITLQGGEAVMPPRSHRKEQRAYDKAIYSARNLVERLFLKLKNFRRVATRYERLTVTYAAMINLAASLLWLGD